MGKKIGITILLVALVTIGISAVALRNKGYKELKGTPDEIIITALENTNQKIMEEQEALNEKLGINKQEAILASKAKELYFNLDLNEADQTNNILGNLQLGTNKLKGDLKLINNQKDLLEIQAYRDGDKAGLNIPQLFETPYAVKLSTFKEDYQKSALATLIGNDDFLTESNEVITAATDYIKGIWALKDNKQFMQENMDLQRQLLKSFNIQESSQKTNTTNNWIAYTCELNNEQMLDFINQELDLLMQYDFVKNYFAVLAKAADMTLEDFMAQINNELTISENVKADVTFEVDDKYFRGLSIQLKEDDLVRMTIETYYLGNENLLENILICLESETEGINMRVEVGQTSQNALYEENVTVTLNESFEEDQYLTGMTYHYTYDTAQKDNNIALDFNFMIDDDLTIAYSTNGTMTIDQDKVDVTLPNGEVILKDSQNEEKVQVDLNYGMQKIKEKDIAIDVTGETYLFEMDEEALNHAVEVIQNNAMQVLFGLN